MVDDGSTNHTREVCHSFRDRVRYIYQENDGTYGAGARAKAMSEAKGEWIAILDQDDRWCPTKIEAQLNALGACPQAGAVFTGYKPIDADGNIAGPARPAGPAGEVFHELLRRNLYCASSALVRRSIIKHSNLLDNDCGPADYALWLRIARHYPVVTVDECLTEYRVHTGNFSADLMSLAKAGLQLLRQQKFVLQPDCLECEDSLRIGCAYFSELGADAYLNQYHQVAKNGYLLKALPSF